ncbi:MAG: triphosphoribosyl-dephospho-CoA synthase [Candidatus Thorarchaeota archaeon]
MRNIAWEITSLAQLAMLLEVSSPKPGNVNRSNDFSDMAYRNFLATAALAARGYHLSAQRGIRLARGGLAVARTGIGGLILTCSRDCFRGINQSNTIFGTIALYVPLIVSASAAITESGRFTVAGVRRWFSTIMSQTTVDDSIDFVRALKIAGPGGNMNRLTPQWTSVHTRYDIESPTVELNLVEDSVTLERLLAISASVDQLSSELHQRLPTTLDFAYPLLHERSGGLDSIEEAIVDTYLQLLALRPDGLIAKKMGSEAAEMVRRLAESCLHRRMRGEPLGPVVAELDDSLRSSLNSLNPGTTADIVSAAVFCELLSQRFDLSEDS